MQLKIVDTRSSPARLLIQGPSGSGKTYTALLLAYGLCGAYEKIAVIDTDSEAARLYGYFGAFHTLGLSAPYTPQKFIDALTLCEQAGIEAIIIDSLSAEWIGCGGVQEQLKEDSEEALLWHQSLIDVIKASPCHLIATLQVEEAYRLIIAGSKREVEKYGLKPLQKEDIHYHFHTVLALDMKHKARSLKDRTSFFEEHSGVILTEEISALFAKWCGEKAKTKVASSLETRINSCASIGELLELMFFSEPRDAATLQAFIKRRLYLESLQEQPILSRQNSSANGTDHYRATA